MVRVYMSWLQNSRFLGSRSNCFAGRREIDLYRIGSLCALTRSRGPGEDYVGASGGTTSGVASRNALWISVSGCGWQGFDRNRATSRDPYPPRASEPCSWSARTWSWRHLVVPDPEPALTLYLHHLPVFLFTFICSLPFAEGARRYLTEAAGVPHSYVATHGSGMVTVRYAGRPQVRSVFRLLHQGAAVYLPRKREKVDHLL